MQTSGSSYSRHRLKQRTPADDIELWVALGTEANLLFIEAHEVANPLGSDVALGLPAFHAFPGCDTVSLFHGKNKKLAVDTWNTFPQLTSVFIGLSSTPRDIPDDWMLTLDHFIVLLYDRTSTSPEMYPGFQIWGSSGPLFEKFGGPLQNFGGPAN